MNRIVFERFRMALSLNGNSAHLTDKHPSVDLPGAFNATNRTIQKVANIAIAPYAKYPI